MPAIEPVRARHGGGVRTFCLTLLGLLLAQTAWALVVPPFRGIDEHEHAFKAAAVARGDWHADHPVSPSGWGEVVTVPTDLAEAALPICKTLPYVRDNCTPRPSPEPGMSQVGSSAARYNPAFYAIIGTVALPFHGATALYAMRATTALMCALMMALAFTTARSWSRSAWVPAGFLIAATPVTIYSQSIASPNGVELAAAFLVWASLLGVARSEPGDPRVGRLLACAAVGAVPLAVVRTLGPLWLVLIVATCMLVASREQLLSAARTRAFRRAVAVVVVLGSFGPIWSLTAKSNAVGDTGAHVTGFWGDLPGQWGLWWLQSVAAFPARDEMAPMALYAVAFPLLWVLLAVSWRFASGRERWTLVAIVATTTVVASAVTFAAYASMGPIWQGRYGYPYAAGFLLLCGSIMDRRAGTGRSPSAALIGVGLVTITLNVIGMVHVLHRQLRVSPLVGSSDWPTPSTLLVVVLVIASTGLLVLAGAGPLTGRGRPGSRQRLDGEAATRPQLVRAAEPSHH